MISREQIEYINTAYLPLEAKQREIKSVISDLPYKIVTGWYNGHYHRNENGCWERTAYPIPEVDLMGLCDIEIYFHRVCVTTKMRRDKALEYNFSTLDSYQFEAYGVVDYLNDFYREGISFQSFRDAILNCSEDEIGFTFSVPLDSEIRPLILLFMQEGFYY